jgi:hypothetical protein
LTDWIVTLAMGLAFLNRRGATTPSAQLRSRGAGAVSRPG